MNEQENGNKGNVTHSFIRNSNSLDSQYKLPTFDWLKNIPQGYLPLDLVEVRFKNTRKGFFNNVNKLRLHKGDVVAVEASPGHDIGIVSLTGELVFEQIRRHDIDPEKIVFKKVYRKAKPADVEKWEEARSAEHATMLKARKIATDLNLNMKIGDVEYQGDNTKAIFYYIADERVDFRELIKILASTFKIRIEMRQIGARQEAGRIGGIGPCGRELCCTTWLRKFTSVTTNSARYQDLSLNPQKLAGQCGKLKCCLNYELDCYIDAQKDFPDPGIPLETLEGTAFHQKTDIFSRKMWYSFNQNSAINSFPVSIEMVRKIIEQNKKGIKPKSIIRIESEEREQEPGFENVVGQESITRFDHKHKKRKKRHRR